MFLTWMSVVPDMLRIVGLPPKNSSPEFVIKPSVSISDQTFHLQLKAPEQREQPDIARRSIPSIHRQSVGCVGGTAALQVRRQPPAPHTSSAKHGPLLEYVVPNRR
jgi:hypothetical protein